MNNQIGAFPCRLPFNYIFASNFPNVVICIFWKFSIGHWSPTSNGQLYLTLQFNLPSVLFAGFNFAEYLEAVRTFLSNLSARKRLVNINSVLEVLQIGFVSEFVWCLWNLKNNKVKSAVWMQPRRNWLELLFWRGYNFEITA